MKKVFRLSLNIIPKGVYFVLCHAKIRQEKVV